MTISSLLSRGVTPAVPINRFELSGSALGDTDIFHNSDRVSYGHGHGGGKGWKGNQSAMSALTLLAFLFFINLLQQCLKENMATGTALLMIRQANRTAPAQLVRPSRDIKLNDTQNVDALPGPGVYWDSNILIRHKGDPAEDDKTSDIQENDIFLDNPLNILYSTNTEHSELEHHYLHKEIVKEELKDKQSSEEDISKDVSIGNDQETSQVNQLSTDNKDELLHKYLETSADQFPKTNDAQFTSEEQWQKVSMTSKDDLDVGYYKYSTYNDDNDYDNSDWDYYQSDYDSDLETETRDFSTTEVTGGGFVNDRYDGEESASLSSIVNFPLSFGNYFFETISSFSGPIFEKAQKKSQCSTVL